MLSLAGFTKAGVSSRPAGGGGRVVLQDVPVGAAAGRQLDGQGIAGDGGRGPAGDLAVGPQSQQLQAAGLGSSG